MNWLDKLERKLGRYAIPNLTVYLLAGYVIGFAVMNFMPSLLNWLTLEPGLVIRGQVWRIISWVLIPPSTNLISLIFLVLLYYSLGSALERTWGTFRYNVYIFSGILFTVVAAFLLYGALYLIYGVEFSLSSVGLISTNYITMSIFLAFAAIYPDMEVLLYFILPIKMKWMAVVYAVLVLIDVIGSGWGGRVTIICSLLNFVVFYLATRDYRRVSPKEMHRKQAFRNAMNGGPGRGPGSGRGYGPGNGRPGSGPIARHKCAICGRTELTNPELEFRFCSKCNGNYEYCQDHLFTHTHVK